MSAPRPLSGLIILDLSRMLPGAVLARFLVDLGARVIKVEDPGMGDPMRSAPPLVAGIGAGWRAFLRGVESVCLDLRKPKDARALRKLVKQADVLVESFRPGTLARWGLGREQLTALNGGLITVSLSGFGQDSQRVAHDLNLVAASGLLDLLGTPKERLPGTQIADVATGMLAATSLLAALLQRHQTHRGMHLDQPLSAGPLPFLTWPVADHVAGEPGLPETILAGEAPAYATYTCQDGLRLAVAVFEPKFWAEFATLLELPQHAGSGLLVGADGRRVYEAVAAKLAEKPRDAWLDLFDERNLPVTPVNDMAAATAGDAAAIGSGKTPVPSGAVMGTGPWLPAFAPGPLAAAPALGAHTETVFAEFGLG